MKVIPAIRSGLETVWQEVRPLLVEHVGFLCIMLCGVATALVLSWVVK